jgi:hypothetical protein
MSMYKVKAYARERWVRIERVGSRVLVERLNRSDDDDL